MALSCLVTLSISSLRNFYSEAKYSIKEHFIMLHLLQGVIFNIIFALILIQKLIT